MMQHLVIKNGDVLLAEGRLAQVDIRTVDGKIIQIGQELQGEQELDATGHYVLPGLIDLHQHGIGFESCESDTLDEFARLEASRGATTFFPTLFAAPDKSTRLMARHRRNTDELRRLPQIGGFRLESPYLAHTGAGLADDLALPSRATTNALLAAGGGHIRIVDISPELPGALDEIRYLSAQGIVCSLAHTEASIAQARAAVDAGARLVTHLFDTFVLPSLDDPDPGVYPAGLVDYLLVEDRVMCEIIGDGTHVHPLLVEKALRCKTPDRLVFVTDSNLGAGLAPGDYELPNNWGRGRIQGPNNGVRLVDRDMALAGSALTPLDSLKNAVNLFGQPLAVASVICARTPARLLGLNKGEIAIGKDADLIVVDHDLELRHTIVAGIVIYTA